MKEAEIYAKKYLESEITEIRRSGRNSEIPELTIYEKAVIFKYSNDGYQDLNEKLRIHKGENTTEFGKILVEALSKLKHFEGVVYRGVNLLKYELEKYTEAFANNVDVSEPTFISTSKSRLVAMSYRGNTLFRIYSRRGKEIEKIAKFGSSSQNEKEVLFAPNSRFNILDVTTESNYTLITMEEI